MDISTVITMLIWLFGYVLGAYLVFQLWKYLKNKPLGEQTVLDILYAHMFEYWAIFHLGILIIWSLIEITPIPWILAMIIGWTTVFFGFCCHVNLMPSGILRLVMIFNQQILENIQDGTMNIIFR